MRLLTPCLLGAILLSSCSDPEPAPSPAPKESATPSTTAENSGCPVDPVTCETAQRVVSALEVDDVAGLMLTHSPIEATCPVPRPPGLGGPYPLCDDAIVDGEVRSGYLWSSGTHGGLADEARFRKDLTRLATSNLPVRSIGCEIKAGTTNVCIDDFVLVFGPNNPGIPTVFEVPVRRGDSAAPDGILGVMPVFVPGCDSDSASAYRCERLTGGAHDLPTYRYWGTDKEGGSPPRMGRYFLWQP